MGTDDDDNDDNNGATMTTTTTTTPMTMATARLATGYDDDGDNDGGGTTGNGDGDNDGGGQRQCARTVVVQQQICQSNEINNKSLMRVTLFESGSCTNNALPGFPIVRTHSCRVVNYILNACTHEKRTTKTSCEGTKMSHDGLTLGKINFWIHSKSSFTSPATCFECYDGTGTEMGRRRFQRWVGCNLEAT
jgi:hypothetical protein